MILLSRTEQHAKNQSEPKQRVNILICLGIKNKAKALHKWNS
jgi:hypothetical protein